MGVKLYMDEHVPLAITRGLQLRGVDVMTVMEDGHDATADSIILDRAARLVRVVFTRDDDFLREATFRQRTGRAFGGVIYCHQMGLTVGACIRDLELIATATEISEYQNRVEYLPL